MTAPLDGIRVIDFSRVLAGPHCGRMLVDLGADVIKVEPPDGDLTRVFLPRVNSLALYHVQQNCGKRNVSLDFALPEAVELAARLTEQADVVLENFRPGVMERMGLGYERLAERNPRLVYASISGFGQDGPWSQRRAYARIVHAEVGMMLSDAEQSGRDPEHSQYSHADVYTSLECLAGLLAALYQREQTGRGQHVEVAMAETMLCINEHVASDLFAERQGIEKGTAGRGRDPVVAMKDGRWVTIAGDPAAAEAFSRICRACGHPELIDDPAYAHFKDRRAKRPELLAMIQRAVLEMDSLEEVQARFGEQQLPVGLLRSLDEFVASPWAEHRNAVIDVSDRNGGTIGIPNSPWRFSDGETGVRGQPAYRGEHNKEVLIEMLRLTNEDVDALIDKGVLSSRGPSARR